MGQWDRVWIRILEIIHLIEIKIKDRSLFTKAVLIKFILLPDKMLKY
jgi:hypothetical protein